MFRVVVLLETMTVGKGVANDRQQSVGQNFGNVELGVHYSIENNESPYLGNEEGKEGGIFLMTKH